MKVRIGFEVEKLAMQGDQDFVISNKIIPHGKHDPLWVEDGGKKVGNIQLDCTAIELVTAPTTDPNKAWDLYNKVLSQAKELLPPGVELSNKTLGKYDIDDLLDSPEAMEIGCSAAFDAYGDPRESTTPSQYYGNERFAGIHVNIDTPREWKRADKIAFVRRLDETLGEHSVDHWEKDQAEDVAKRRQLYGGAGNYRLTPFGVEYRTLPSGGFWSKEAISKIYELVEEAFKSPFSEGDENTRNKINYKGVTA